MTTKRKSPAPHLRRREDELDILVAVMTEPPGPLASKAKVHWHRRPRSGPQAEDARRALD